LGLKRERGFGGRIWEEKGSSRLAEGLGRMGDTALEVGVKKMAHQNKGQTQRQEGIGVQIKT